MRFKIHLQTRKPGTFLPIDYQYSLASAVYKLISNGDEAYSRFLHDEGFSAGGLKRFKLFTFSPLQLPRYTAWKDKGVFELHGSQLSFMVSFMADMAAEAFVKGMFSNQAFSIGDRFHQLDLEVVLVEAIAPPLFNSTTRYRCISPMVIEFKEKGMKYEKYLPPDDLMFEELLLSNLVSKCAALNILHHDGQEHEDMKFTLLGDYRSKLHTIKPYTKEQTKVRGFVFDFELTAPEYIQEMGYYAGFGMNNGMGFGAGIVVD